jgi:hypothetical protein
VKAGAMTGILAERWQVKRRAGEALIREADNLACQSWNERIAERQGAGAALRRSAKRSTADFPGLR